MTYMSRIAQSILAVIVVASIISSSPLAAEKPAPAGQMCRQGAFVIGFDSEGNIICSGDREIAIKPASAKPAPVKPTSVKPTSVKPPPANSPPRQYAQARSVTIPANPELAISDVEPPSVLFGTRKLDITVIGTGFQESSVIIFEGSTYSASVNQDGTRLDATLEIGFLSIGPYAVTVSNGTGVKNMLKKALEIY